MDQAQKLRDLLNPKSAQTIAILGAKGGVGRTSLTANLAVILCRMGLKVCALDLDFRLSSLSLVLGERTQYNLSHVLENGISPMEALHTTREGLSLLAGSHSKILMDLRAPEIKELLKTLEILKKSFDFILMDTPREISEESELIWGWADKMALITTPEPASLVGSYAMVRRLAGRGNLYLIINRSGSKRQEREIADLLCRASEELIDASIVSYGAVPEDTRVMEALCRRSPYFLEFPKAPASRATQAIAYKLQNQEEKSLYQGIVSLFRRIV